MWWMEGVSSVKIDVAVDITISIWSMTTKFGKQVHLKEVLQMR